MATGTKGLMMWCKNITQNYGGDVEIKNMTSSWKNGMAFCAILHHYRPDLIDFNNLSKENIAVNNALAFRVAEDELGIPALLDVEDMVEMKVPDRLSILTYVSQYYNYFKDKTPGDIITHRIPSKKRTHSENIEATPAKKGPQIYPTTANAKTGSFGKSNCFICDKTVYLMERLSVEGKLFHRVCFKCCVCDMQLKTSTYEYDRKEEKFYCDHHYKEKGKKMYDLKGKEDTPLKESLSNISEDIVMSDDVKPSTMTGNGHANFKRNEQFVRRGIRPQSSPADLQWEKPHVIKSKGEELESPTKTKSAAKSFLSSIIKRKSSIDDNQQVDFSNPAYQQHLDLSNFMNQLDEKNSKTASPIDGVAIGSDSLENKTSTLSGVRVSDPNSESSLAKFSGEIESKDNDKSVSKGIHKKKLVLKVKKKKKDVKKNVDPEQGGKPIKPYAIVEFPATNKTNKDYENIESFPNIDEISGEKLEQQNYEYEKQKDTQADDENHYAAPSAIPADHDNVELIYHNISPEQPEEKQNPLLIAARNRLHSTTNPPERDTIEDKKDEKSDENEGNPYLNIRSNLRKSRSTENLNMENKKSNDNDKNGNDDSLNIFLAARSHLQKSNISKSEQNFSQPHNTKTTQHGVLIKRKETDNIQQTFLNARAALHSTGRLQAELESEKTYSIQEDDKLLNKPDTAGNTNIVSEDGVNKEKLQFSPFKIEKKTSIKLKKVDSPTEKHNIILDTFHDDDDISHTSLSTHEISVKEPDSSEMDVDKSKDETLNPFLTPDTSPTMDRKSENTNPFLSSTEDLLFEDSDDDRFEESNPFADDARLERRATLDRKKGDSLKREAEMRRSIEKKKSLKAMGIDDSNPFADDLMKEDSDDENQHLKLQKSESIHVPEVTSHLPNSGKKLKLKTKQKANRPVSAPVGITGPIPVAKPRKRMAPKTPNSKKEEVEKPIMDVSIEAGKGTLKKRQAPKPPGIPTEFMSDTELSNKERSSDKNENVEVLEMNKDSDDSIITDLPEPSHKADVSVTQNGAVLTDRESEHGSTIVTPEHEQDNSLETSDSKSTHTPPQRPSPPKLDRKMSEKRKAPSRPLRPPAPLDESLMMRNVALRDKQPKREEMEQELRFLETRQRELEMDGVVMEKKLRENDGGEPEEAYLMTWFELVNQKNLLLRRENELIYMCQELDFLQNQRRAEFELRQLMNKPEKEKTMADRMREDALLADILNFVTKRSNIVDKMDEDRLREYEEDQEISNMMESQGLSPSHRKISQDTNEKKDVNKKKKEKEKKKEKVKKKKK